MTAPRTQPKKRNASYHMRREAFARAFVRLGTAAAAFRECFPHTRSWKPDCLSREAGRLIKDPDVQAEVQRLQDDARLDAIASRQEIARTVAAIMRGTATESRTVTVRNVDGSTAAQIVEVAPALSVRLRAAKDLERMLPAVIPETGPDTHDETKDTLAQTLTELRKRRARTT